MNSRERFLAALSLEQPDRVPHFELGYNESSIIGIARHFTSNVPDLKPFGEMTDKESIMLLGALFTLIEELDVDGIAAIGYLLEEKQEPVGGGLIKDEWGVISRRSPWGISYPVDVPIKDPSDFKTYKPPKVAKGGYLMMYHLLKERFGDERAVVLDCYDCFARSWRLRGMENYLMDFILHPQLAHDLARMVSDFFLQVLELALQAGVEIVVVEDDYAQEGGLMMSPAHFDEFL